MGETQQLSNYHLGAKSPPSMSTMRFLIKSGLLLNLLISSFIILAVCSTQANLAEARRSSSTSSSLLTKKPPYNGSIFGKRSGPPPTPAPAPVGAYLGSSGLDYQGSDQPSTSGMSNTDSNGYLVALYEQQQQLQQQQSTIARAFAINRCLIQRELSTEVEGTTPGSCDELMAYFNTRSRFG